MRRLWFFLLIVFAVFSVFFIFNIHKNKGSCFIGAFIADSPTKEKIASFQKDFGKKPYFVMVFVDWEKFIDTEVTRTISESGSVIFITWEPWIASGKLPIDYDGLLTGKYDDYIASFANRIKLLKEDVFLRFAHEMNGNWYPWSVGKLGNDKYIAITRHIVDIFRKEGARNARFVFSVNWENVPASSDYLQCYPGDTYVDYIAIDGYNWGSSQPWSRWMSFKELFGKTYSRLSVNFNKPILISEFSSSSKGGDKARWIKEAMQEIRRMKNIKAFILFNLDKETDWAFDPSTLAGEELRKQLSSAYFLAGVKKVE